MIHLADSADELRQGGKDWQVGWKGIPMNNCSSGNRDCLSGNLSI